MGRRLVETLPFRNRRWEFVCLAFGQMMAQARDRQTQALALDLESSESVKHRADFRSQYDFIDCIFDYLRSFTPLVKL